MNILYISPYLPASNVDAGRLKMFEEIRLLVKKHKIYLVAFVTPEENCSYLALEELGCKVYPFRVEYNRLPFKCAGFTNLIENLLKDLKPDFIQCEYSFITRYLPSFKGVGSLITIHDIYFISYFRRAKIENNLFLKLLFLLKSAKNLIEEGIRLRRFKTLVVFSERDKDILTKLIGRKTEIRVVPLSINPDFYSSSSLNFNGQLEKEFDLCFLANFSHLPNVDGLLFFIKKVLPVLRKQKPEVSLLVIGRNPPERLLNLSQKIGVNFTGFVEDIGNYLLKSKVFICPIRFGSGLRGKILQAWAMALPVISTPVGCEGLIVKDGENILMADDKEDFAKKIIRLLDNEYLMGKVGMAGRDTLDKHYNLTKNISLLENIYRGIK